MVYYSMSRFKKGDLVRSSGKHDSDGITAKHYLILKKADISGIESNPDTYRVWWLEGGKEILIVLDYNIRFHEEVINGKEFQERPDGQNNIHLFIQ